MGSRSPFFSGKRIGGIKTLKQMFEGEENGCEQLSTACCSRAPGRRQVAQGLASGVSLCGFAWLVLKRPLWRAPLAGAWLAPPCLAPPCCLPLARPAGAATLSTDDGCYVAQLVPSPCNTHTHASERRASCSQASSSYQQHLVLCSSFQWATLSYGQGGRSRPGEAKARGGPKGSGHAVRLGAAPLPLAASRSFHRAAGQADRYAGGRQTPSARHVPVTPAATSEELSAGQYLHRFQLQGQAPCRGALAALHTLPVRRPRARTNPRAQS